MLQDRPLQKIFDKYNIIMYIIDVYITRRRFHGKDTDLFS